ncbi:NADH dehydrogenase [ubiquinone] iron-sulfur protein 4, mitochondrial [Plasmodiophora brassicae]|uniref:NADH dehydrogenase [ubiquinone] iron-sulfur protein 4, mitochondrial n=1 Tax=Plasmodiophora brassicae TaxID=37360 RepID=A0A0G4J797_PLABS|nr:hypothetical protein PBRA_009378 [Plasmodiophora brassicae]SPQ99500.1 unnamed protein product [Plasmodiophora brassicae]
MLRQLVRGRWCRRVQARCLLTESKAPADRPVLFVGEDMPGPTVVYEDNLLHEQNTAVMKRGEFMAAIGGFRNMGPEDFLDDYRAIISKPAPPVGQQGDHHPIGLEWRMTFEPHRKWASNVMGWTASKDVYAGHRLWFDSAKSAIRFAESMGIKYHVQKPHEKTARPQPYAANFRWKGAPAKDVSDQAIGLGEGAQADKGPQIKPRQAEATGL